MTDNKRKKVDIIERRPFDLWTDRDQFFMDQLFDQFRANFSSLFLNPRAIVGENRVPPMDIVDLGDRYEINAELPGISKDNINIEVMSNGVEISAKEDEVIEDKDKDWLRHERISTSFYRYFELPEDIKTEEVDAKMKNGVIILTIPKVKPEPRVETKKIKIK